LLFDDGWLGGLVRLDREHCVCVELGFLPSLGGISMKIRPLQDRILVKRLQGEEKTASGIIIPDNAKEKPQEAEVIAVGAGKVLDDGKLRKPDVKVGDRVLFSKYAGSEVKIDGHEHLILREDDLLGVLV
jgi:chaperonin GroES